MKLVQRQSGPVFYLKYRLADGRQVQKLLGPAHTGKSRPPAGHSAQTNPGSENHRTLKWPIFQPAQVAQFSPGADSLIRGQAA